MRVNVFVLKMALFFAIFVFLLSLLIGYLSLVPFLTILYRSAIAFTIAGIVGMLAFSLIENTIKEELIVMNDRDKDKGKGRRINTKL